ALVAGGTWFWTGRRPAPAPYPSQTFTHAFGKTKVAARPDAVAAMTLQDADTVLSLGVQPVALVAPGGTVPSWLNPLIKGSPTVLANAEVKGLEPVKPDLIIDTSADESAFKALSEKAPTIAAPKSRALQWTSTDEISWLAKVLGQQAAGEALISKLAVSTAKARRDHEFVGKSISVVNFSAAGLTLQLPNSPAAGYLSQLGFRYKLGGYQFDKIEDGTDAKVGVTEMPIQSADAYGLKSDVVLILRTDPAAKNGGFGGLPSSFSSLTGTSVIVDQPDTVWALTSGGPAAIGYLNTALVDQLAKQIK
ncbi:ABC transporter substrate-binding protein, partial [Mycolicibacterium insubricum]